MRGIISGGSSDQIDTGIINGGIMDGIINVRGGGFLGGGRGWDDEDEPWIPPGFVRDFRALLEDSDSTESGVARQGAHLDLGEGAVLTYKFATDWSQIPWVYDDHAEETYRPLTAQERASCIESFARLEAICNVTFVEVPVDETADIFFGGAYDNGMIAGYTFHPDERIADTQVWFDDDLPANLMFEVAMHELGHVMGLKHPFEGQPLLVPELDNTRETIMSYTRFEIVSKYGPLDRDALTHLYGGAKGDFNAQYSEVAGRVEISLNDNDGQSFFAGHGDSHIQGSDGDDLIEIGFGADIVVGGGGTDIVALPEGPEAYLITVDNGLYGVMPLNPWRNDEPDIMVGVEQLRFSWSDVATDPRETRNLDDLAVDVSVTNPVYRFFNMETETYFYSNDPAERNAIVETMVEMSYQGAQFRHASADDPDAIAMHRFYNADTRTHFYTASPEEVALVQETLPQLVYEGAAYHGIGVARDGSAPLHRFFDLDTGTHVYTADVAEAGMFMADTDNYSYEGSPCWVFI